MMNKVDTASAAWHFENHDGAYISLSPDFGSNPATHAPYRREPYISADIPLTAGGTEHITGKAGGWTSSAVLVQWVDTEGARHNVWVEPAQVQRIRREESTWLWHWI
ncbi:hypothetical protein [Arthrobacter sp. H14]|uniref:hypothetical protein n=2 Tax=Arthrobacter sp. H14 TaxID=1312959 RepID=UPI0012DC526E|nr:hypothetical protein [Arthrobacter sp. H14]